MSFHSLLMAFQSRLLFVSAIMLLIVPSNLMGQNPFRVQRAESDSRMRVLEFERAPVQRHYFTIIGAVQLPGVFYTTDRDRVPLRDLLAAAEGTTRDASRTVNVVQNGQFVARSFEFTESSFDEWISANEIVVIVPDPSAPFTNQEIIPVACVGLTDRPVVFPLSTEVLTIGDLSRRLQLSTKAEETCRVLDPHGREQTRVLLSGSVVAFDSRTIDAESLQNSRLLPPTVPIDHSQHELTQQPAESPSAGPALEPYTPPPTIQANGVVEAIHEENTDTASNAERPVAAYIRRQGKLRQVSASDVISKAKQVQQKINNSSASVSESHPQRRRSTAAAPLPPLMEDAGESKRISKSQGKSVDESRSAGGIGPWLVATVVGLCAGICLWGAIVWSRIDRKRENVVRSLFEAAPSSSDGSVGNVSVKSILDQSIPMIEEEVIAPADVALHGEPIQPEVLAANDAVTQSETEVYGHSNLDAESNLDQSDSAVPDSPSEQELQVVAESPKRIGLSNPGEESVDRRFIPKSVISLDEQVEFDVVLPDPEAMENKLGPLERALRSLRKEDAA